MDTNYKILVVDDETLNRTIMQEYLEEKYQQVEYSIDGASCLEKISSFQPDLILLDVSMPNMSGYEVCKKIRGYSEYDDIIIIFVSARGSPEDRMEGFRVGGEDYIIKPFTEFELLKKIETTFKHCNKVSNLQTMLKSSNSAAFEAMMGNYEMGAIVQFLDLSSNLESLEEMSRAIIEFINILGLKACVRINDGNNKIYRTYRGNISQLEQETIDVLSTKGRIYHFDHRSQFNYDHINLLIINMPINEDMKYGRLKDAIPIALNVANSSISHLQLRAKKNSGERQKEIDKVKIERRVKEVNSIIINIKQCIKDVTKNSDQALADLYDSLEKRLPLLGLEEDQEQEILSKIDNALTLVKESLIGLQSVQNNIIKIHKITGE